jgi:hypothetical protein
MRATSGSSSFGCTQPRSPPCSAVWLWLNCAATTGNGAPPRSSWITPAAQPGVGGVGRVVDRHEDLAHPVLGLAGLLLQQALLVGDLGLRDLRLLAKLLADHVGPSDLHAQLVDQGAQVDAAAGELVAHAVRLHAVALLDVVQRLGDLLVGHHDVAALHLLQAQPLVDQLARRLAAQPVEHLGRDLQAGRQRQQPAAVVDVALGDHVPVHHGDDAARLRRRGPGGEQRREGGGEREREA